MARFKERDSVVSTEISTQSGRILRGKVEEIGLKGHITVRWDDGTLTCERPTSVFMRTVSKDV